ncbi:MAG TPA: serine hydrolase domain-containing protein [Steroidobacteraceae bacterium]|jgi:CubicO group peptidase (beta-lactamase class C family)
MTIDSSASSEPERRRFLLPQGWTFNDGAPVPTMACPEGDLQIAFVELESAATVQATAFAAWRKFDPAFDAPVLQEHPTPSSGGWDKTYQVVFSTPASESRLQMAFIRTLGSHAYVNLLWGTNAAASRRGAQLAEAIGSWKPEGLKEISLNAEAQRWGAEHSRQLKGFALSAMSSLNIPGASIAVVQDGHVVYSEGLGVRSLNHPEPVTAQTRFMIGSTTKALTTLLMARLVDQKWLSWSAKVVDLLKGFALADPEITEQLEMRHTVSASTGMPRQDYEFIFRHSRIVPEARIAEMRTMRPTTGFGEIFQYSNLLVAVGGYAAARACIPDGSLEDAFDKSIKEQVFHPLGMNDTCLRQEEALRGNAAAPHAAGFDGHAHNIPLVMENSVYSVAPAGGAWSTAPDLARYLLMELANGRPPGADRFISEEALLERRRPGIKIDDKNSYGLGLIISQESGLHVIHHGGNTLGFSADMYFLPESGFGAVVLTNAYGAIEFLAALRQKVRELVFGAEARAENIVETAKRAKQDALARLQTRVKTDPESTGWIKETLGMYRSPELGAAHIAGNEQGYRVHFDEWTSDLAAEVQPSGDRLLRLISPPWAGALKMLVGSDELILDAAQMKYVFKKGQQP